MRIKGDEITQDRDKEREEIFDWIYNRFMSEWACIISLSKALEYFYNSNQLIEDITWKNLTIRGIAAIRTPFPTPLAE